MTLEYLDEYRSADLVHQYLRHIESITTRPWKIMEACGGQTHSIVKYGIDKVLPANITLVHGPGCPVCVTPISTIDAAIKLASQSKLIFCTFGDMLRVPGTDKDLMSAKAEGGDVRIVYSPLDAVKIARDNPASEVVFFAVGFETTAPANAMAVYQASQLGITNFSILASQVAVPPALKAILDSPINEIDGFLAPGHVCTIAGYAEYEQIARDYHVPIVVTGFEPGDILQGIAMCVLQLEQGRAEVENQYTRTVNKQGNHAAQAMVNEVFAAGDKLWRGLGQIKMSGMRLANKYRAFDAEIRFALGPESDEEKSGCISGLILQGIKKPGDCPLFGKVCRPEKPVGATMVSSEGACAAYYRYRREEFAA
jgi:hydrogenase expression/formation protein HypD